MFPVSCRLSTRRHSLLEPSCPRWMIRFPYGQRTEHNHACPDSNGIAVFHTSETRPGWVPSISRDRRCSLTEVGSLRQRLPQFQRLVLTHCHIAPAGLIITRHHQGFTVIHPSGLPLHL